MASTRYKNYKNRQKTYGIPGAHFFRFANRIPLFPPITPVLGICYLRIFVETGFQNIVVAKSQNKNLSPWVFAGAKVRGL